MFNTQYYSIILKDASQTIVILAEDMRIDENIQCYTFYINDNIVAMIPYNMILDCRIL